MLIKGQAATEQAIKDLTGSVEKGFGIVRERHNDFDNRIRSVEKKVWYSGGVGAGIGTAVGLVITWLKH
jgi:ElaB/YqjD/DUF883 family membrane-anchored ribosome-binding protein